MVSGARWHADVVSGAMWHADVASGTTARIRRGTEATWQGRVAHARRRWRTGRGHVAGGHACPRESTPTPVWGATWQGGSAFGGPMG